MKRKGLLIDYDYCSGCQSCVVACKQEHGHPAGKFGIKVDEKVFSDPGARMDVDARAAMGPFGHHSRNQRHAELVQRMGQPIYGHGFQAGIAKDHLVEGLARRTVCQSPPCD